MTLVSEMIDLAVDDKTSLSVLLRKALVLAHKLKNQRLKDWVFKELNGYAWEDKLPSYRDVSAGSVGLLSAGYGLTVNNYPLPSVVLSAEHRKLTTRARLAQPVAAYEKLADGGENPQIHWNTNLVLLYRNKFLKGYDLLDAWQPIPNSVIVAVPEAVRNRLLQFTLELDDEMSSSGTEDPQTISPTKVDQYVTNHIYGGNVVFTGTASNFTQNSTSGVQAHDLAALIAFVKTAGVPEPTVIELEQAAIADGQSRGSGIVGPRTQAWLDKIGTAGLQVGTSVSIEALTQAVHAYFS